jgi:hypothetical protein
LIAFIVSAHLCCALALGPFERDGDGAC